MKKARERERDSGGSGDNNTRGIIKNPQRGGGQRDTMVAGGDDSLRDLYID